MDDSHAGGYRDAATPPPERFPVRMGAAARIAVLLMLGSIVLSLALLPLTGRFHFLFFVALGPGLFYLVSGAPRLIEVHHDRVEIHSWLRRPVRMPASELTVVVGGTEVAFESSDAELPIPHDHFPDGSLTRLVAALRERGVRVIELG